MISWRSENIFLHNSPSTILRTLLQSHFQNNDRPRRQVYRGTPGINGLTHLHSELNKKVWRFWKYFTYKSVFLKLSEGEMLIRCWTTNSPSNILWNFALFLSYFQKYMNSRRQFLKKLNVNGLELIEEEMLIIIRSQTTTPLQIFSEISLYSQVISKNIWVAEDTF